MYKGSVIGFYIRAIRGFNHYLYYFGGSFKAFLEGVYKGSIITGFYIRGLNKPILFRGPRMLIIV